MKSVQIGKYLVGPGQPCFTIAEIGINHNGDLDIAKKLIEISKAAGFQAVKFQKRTIDVVYTPEELQRPRENPFGETNGDLKRGLEFGADEYREIDRFCESREMMWMASCWDEASVDFINDYNVACFKIASASLTDDALLRHHKKTGRPLILSTGMSTLQEMDHAVSVLGKENLIVLHCTSTYPSKVSELNLKVIAELHKRYGVPIGYSGHEVGLATTQAAIVLGACVIERHVTLDRAMWGSDQAASVEPQGMVSLIKNIRAIESAMGDGEKVVYESEKPILKKLRRNFSPVSRP